MAPGPARSAGARSWRGELGVTANGLRVGPPAAGNRCSLGACRSRRWKTEVQMSGPPAQETLHLTDLSFSRGMGKLGDRCRNDQKADLPLEFGSVMMQAVIDTNAS